MKREASRYKLFSNLKENLQRPLPGLEAQLKMVTDPRPGNMVYTEVLDSSKTAGVLVLLYFKGTQSFIVLTRRTDLVEHHQAQISFPGGRQEEGETLEQTALRETCEELGISSSEIQILGPLTPLYIPPTNYCIYPLVARLQKLPQFKPSPYEVAEVLELPLRHLIDPHTRKKEIWTLRGKKVQVPFYYFKGHKIWGATAMVLAEFVEILKSFLGGEGNEDL